MKQALEDLKEFHRVFQAAAADRPTLPDEATYLLRRELIREECQELLDAMRDDNMVEIADGLADLCYVVIGTAVSYGIPLDKVWKEVHRSNMAKASRCDCLTAGRHCLKCNDTGYIVTRRPDGKVLKPEGWTSPQIRDILESEK